MEAPCLGLGLGLPQLCWWDVLAGLGSPCLAPRCRCADVLLLLPQSALTITAPGLGTAWGRGTTATSTSSSSRSHSSPSTSSPSTSSTWRSVSPAGGELCCRGGGWVKISTEINRLEEARDLSSWTALYINLSHLCCPESLKIGFLNTLKETPGTYLSPPHGAYLPFRPLCPGGGGRRVTCV